ncbi:MAG: MarR family winged helix-turn-helix transcriptional regulator [Devosia sp.]
MTDNFAECMVSNSRMAARAITRRYDSYIRPFGLTATQFSLLATIRLGGDRTVSELAEARGFERTTLSRNLGRLEQMGLTASRSAKRGNGRICAATSKGDALFEELLPRWRAVQAEMKQELSEEGFNSTLKVLSRLAKV